MAYTATTVRMMAEQVKQFCEEVNGQDEIIDHAYAMLCEYADRLEQDEQTVEPKSRSHFKNGYLEGQLAVYREIAAMDPMVFEELGVACPACGRGKNHTPDCLWLRATEAVKQPV